MNSGDTLLIVGLILGLLILAGLFLVLRRALRSRKPQPASISKKSPQRLGRLSIGQSITSALKRGALDDQAISEIEQTLLKADVGVTTTDLIIGQLKAQVSRDAGLAEISAQLHKTVLGIVDLTKDRSLRTTGTGQPGVILLVGVNGTGKTTTVGRLAKLLVDSGNSVVLGAADTFRAAAGEQLQTWGERVGVTTVRGEPNADPASVAFKAVETAIAQNAQTVIIDTAGRLHTKTGLMDELGKVKRVIEKQAEVTETLLVIDATTGQNGLAQARVFAQAVQITGVVLTKLDGTAKGGIVLAVQNELGVPVKLVGMGEGIADLEIFDPEGFVSALLK